MSREQGAGLKEDLRNLGARLVKPEVAEPVGLYVDVEVKERTYEIQG